MENSPKQENHPPEHHIHCTLENVRKYGENNHNNYTNHMAQMIAYLQKNTVDYAINSAAAAEKWAKWAFVVGIASFLVSLAALILQFLQLLCS